MKPITKYSDFRVTILLCEDSGGYRNPSPMQRTGDFPKRDADQLNELRGKLQTFCDNFLGEYNLFISTNINVSHHCAYCGDTEESAKDTQGQWHCCERACKETDPVCREAKDV